MSFVALLLFGLFLAPQAEEEQEDYYRRWLERDVVYIITEEEKEVFLKLTTEEERQQFIEQFWGRRDPDRRSAINEFKEEHYRRIAYANDHFAAGLPGWQTDRGRYYIRYGPPDHLESRSGGATYQRPRSEGGGFTAVYPFEIWRYNYIEGVGENVQIEFVDRLGGGLYTVARDEMEKDALLYVPGMGLTEAESYGLTRKAERLQQRYYGDLDQKYRGQFYSPEFRNQPFEKLITRSLLEKPPPIRYNDLRTVVSSRVHYEQVSLKLVVHQLRVSEDTSLVPVTVSLPASHFEIYGRVETLGRRLVYEFDDEIKDESLLNKSLVYQRSIPIRGAGRFKLTLVAKDMRNTRLGTVEKGFVIESFSPEKLELSSLILADEIRRDDQARRFTLSGFTVYPNVGRQFERQGYMGLYLEAYNAAIDSQLQAPSLTVDFRLRRDGKWVDSSPEALPQSDTTVLNLGNRIVITKLLSLKALVPGSYELVAQVRDDIRGEVAERRGRFQVLLNQ